MIHTTWMHLQCRPCVSLITLPVPSMVGPDDDGWTTARTDALCTRTSPSLSKSPCITGMRGTAIRPILWQSRSSFTVATSRKLTACGISRRCSLLTGWRTRKSIPPASTLHGSFLFGQFGRAVGHHVRPFAYIFFCGSARVLGYSPRCPFWSALPCY